MSSNSRLLTEKERLNTNIPCEERCNLAMPRLDGDCIKCIIEQFIEAQDAKTAKIMSSDQAIADLVHQAEQKGRQSVKALSPDYAYEHFIAKAQDAKNRDNDYQAGVEEGIKQGRQSVIKELKEHSREVTATFHQEVATGMVLEGKLSWHGLPYECWQQLLEEVKEK